MDSKAATPSPRTEEECLTTVMALRHGGTSIKCPACGRISEFVPVAKHRACSCKACGYSLYPCAGTPLEPLRTPLVDWFRAIEVFDPKSPGKGASKLAAAAGISLESAKRIEAHLKTAPGETAPAASQAWPDWLASLRSRLRPSSGAPAARETKVETPARLRLKVAGIAVAAIAAAGAIGSGIVLANREPPQQEPISALLPTLTPATAPPSLVLFSIEEDLEAAQAAVDFALANDAKAVDPGKPSVQQPKGSVVIPSVKLPSGNAPPPKGASRPAIQALEPSNGDPNQILSFGPIKIRRHLVDAIVRAARVVGADPSLLMAVADKELSFATEAKAQTSSAEGLFQFIESTWLGVVYEFGAKYGLEKELAQITRSGRQFVVPDAAERERILQLRREPYLSALLAGEMLKRDTLRLEKGLGRHLTGGEIYLIHFLGPEGAQIFIDKINGQPDFAAAELLPKAAQANQPIFYAEAGGQSRTLTVSEVQHKFEEMIRVRLDRYRVVKTGATATK